MNVTPFEMWSGKEPDMNIIKIFRCTAHAKVLGSLKKLENRSKKFILVGYSPKGYRLWDAENKKIILLRDVKFEKDIVNETKKDKKNILSKIEDIEEEQMVEEEKKEESEAKDESSSEEYEDIGG